MFLNKLRNFLRYSNKEQSNFLDDEVLSFREALQESFSWRLREVTLIKNLLENTEKDDDKGVVRKTLILLMYSHYEGFVKESLILYIYYINDLKIKKIDVISNLKVLSLESALKKKMSTQLNFDGFLYLFNNFTQLNDGIFYIREKTIIDTKSNLNFDVLLTNLTRVGICSEPFKDLEKDINAFVNRRNEIAHGVYKNLIQKSEYERWERMFNRICSDFIRLLTNAVENKEYLEEK